MAGAEHPALLTTTGQAPLLLIAAPGTARVVWGQSARQQELPVPRGGILTRFEEAGREWIATGTAPRDDGRELLLFASQQGAVQRLPGPPGRTGSLRHDPVPLVSGGGLVGLAWLQGESLDRLGVWAATWDGASWQGVVQVSPPGPGSQLALTAAALEDRSWLIAWSRFDGEADQIYWSHRRRESWSPPRPVTESNPVPDILPALVATPGGALLAWSRWDGESYRLMLSRWADSSWGTAEALGGRGSLYAAWRRSQEGARLLYREAASSTWELVETDAEGRLLRRASMQAPAEPRPALASPDDATLLFPDGRTETLSWAPVLRP
jgi:hypothetical protein